MKAFKDLVENVLPFRGKRNELDLVKSGKAYVFGDTNGGTSYMLYSFNGKLFVNSADEDGDFNPDYTNDDDVIRNNSRDMILRKLSEDEMIDDEEFMEILSSLRNVKIVTTR